MPLADARPTERTLTDEQSMHRRSFLAGLATTLLAGTAAARAAPMVLRTTIAAGEVYGRSPAMDALPDMERWNAAVMHAIRRDIGAFGSASWITNSDGRMQAIGYEEIREISSSSPRPLVQINSLLQRTS